MIATVLFLIFLVELSSVFWAYYRDSIYLQRENYLQEARQREEVLIRNYDIEVKNSKNWENEALRWSVECKKQAEELRKIKNAKRKK